jgi:hypothetical protein
MSIKKRITITLSDKPYETATSEGKTVEAWYNGPRYLCVSVISGTGQFFAVEATGDSLEDTDPADQVDANRTFLRVDAVADPMIAGLMMPSCVTNPVPDSYEEEIAAADGDLPAVVYVHDYSNNVLASEYEGHPAWNGSSWSMPPRTERPFVDPTEIFNAAEAEAAALVASKDINDYTDDELAQIDAFVAIATSLRTRCAGSAAWKITYPAAPIF